MWKKSFIFSLVLVFAVSSVFCYPSWVYGKTKESLSLEQIPSEEEQMVEEEHQTPSKKERKLQKEDLKDSVKSLETFAKESIVDEELLAAISEYIAVVEDGIEVMSKAYEAEVAYSKSMDERYNNLAAAYANDKGVDYKKTFLEDFSITVNPFVTYSKTTQSFGVGMSTGFGYKDIAITFGAIKPTVKGLDSFKKFDDLMVSAGVAFTF